MTMKFIRPGIDVLLDKHPALWAGRKVALLSHPAAVSASGVHTAIKLRDHCGKLLTALYGPEHGFAGLSGPGEAVESGHHTDWSIPIYSLYGGDEQMDPTMAGWDTLVIDLQDLGVRCYTYVSTLRHMLERSARLGKRVIVTDRPIPHVRIVDGPMLVGRCRSFVGAIPAPLVYGMTQGETALWLKHQLGLDLDLHVIPAEGYRRNTRPERAWPRWVPPSPAIRSWACAMAYPATVFTEALPALDCARATDQAFQVLRAPWLDAPDCLAALRERNIPGVTFSLESERGIRLRITRVAAYRPVYTALALLFVIQQRHGKNKLWKMRGVRSRFFDKLMGSSVPRRMMMDGASPEQIARTWKKEHAAFLRERKPFLLYS